ncbi:extracellular solute-binding protein [Cohnella silvisoli]|uniref:Extracellular solute-binding protein n=1 Tax=Cohnella silvisoli TaxID=2873699 RepID=A0ABV1KRP0_9BACL|nr:extracellular solute-binding protein [Cohnella silvisoli]MCD9022470.1 extracellular solute-binding protein [Cohnella silvisoli]
MRGIKIGVSLAVILLVVCGAYILLHNGWSGSRDSDTDQGNNPEKLTLKFFISGPPESTLPESEKDFVLQAIESKFDVNLEVTVMAPGEDYTETLAAKLAANDPPDMWLNISTDGGAKYTLDNVLADMSYYANPSTMPNYFKYWISEKELREYQVHNKFARAPIPYDRKSYRAYYIRKDWLDHLGLSIPQTYEQYVEVLHAFTYDDPDGNGINDTYGFTTAGNGNSISLEWPEYIKNGLLFPAYYENNQLVDMQTDVRVGQTVTDIVKIMNEGVIDPEWFLNSPRREFDKAVQGKAGIIMGDTADFALDSNRDSLQSRSRIVNPHANWVPFNPFGNRPLRVAVAANYPFVFSNNTAGAKPEKLMKTASILDWLAGEEGYLLTHYGLEGKHYTREGNRITLIPEAIEKDIRLQGDFLQIWDFFTPDAPEVLGFTILDPRVTERDKKILQSLANITVHEGLGTTLTPPFTINVEALRSRQDELQVKMLFSEKSGQNWPKYRDELMTKYNGNIIFKQYEDKIRASRNKR